jgi:putative N6-adenine-specific DNA methylase
MTQTQQKIFLSCLPGLEPALLEECHALGLQPTPALANGKASEEEKGGVEFSGTLEQIYRCNLHLRIASRVVVRLGEFYAAAFSELRKKASRLEWETYLRPGQPVEVKVTCHKSRLYHSDAVAERVRGAIADHLHQEPKPTSKDETAQVVLVRLVNDLCTISIDSSGELLYRRGYRQAIAKAPLRETLAAGLLSLSGWNAELPLVDPFCGSGTIPIEAALISRHIAPGVNRKFSFMQWPIYQPDEFTLLLNQAHEAIHPIQSTIYGSDRDQGAIEMAKANAARTGVVSDIQFVQHAISDLPAMTPQGHIITNPPYGVRIHSNKDLRDLYARFGSLLQQSFSGWKLGVLCSEPQLIHALALGAPQKEILLNNGGIPVKFSLFDIN